MRKFLAVAVLAAALGMNTVARAEGSAEAGRGKSAVCAACHGPDGNSANPEWPSLAGQHASYIVAQLEAFTDGRRQNPLMSPIAQPLSEEDRQDLAAYYGAQTPAPREADPENLERGRKLYVGGDLERGITACIACHGPTGQGNPLARYPAIAGQHASYTAATLGHYASGARSSDPNQIMRSIAARMSAEDIRAVSNYLQGLR
jgi:cytochrome c553